MVDDGSIVDATTILGVALARRRLASRLTATTLRPLSAGAEEYLSWLAVERGRSLNTLAAYRRDLAAWEAWAGDAGIDPASPPPGSVERYLDGLRSAGLGPGLHGPLDHHPAGAVPLPRRRGGDRRPTRPPSCGPRAAPPPPQGPGRGAGRCSAGSVGGTDPADLRDRALLELLYGTGARISEAVGLSLSDLQARRRAPAGVRERFQGATGAPGWPGPSRPRALARPGRPSRRWRPAHGGGAATTEAVFLNSPRRPAEPAGRLGGGRGPGPSGWGWARS